MKVSILIEENIQQVVLTPESEYEKNIVKAIRHRDNDVSFKFGQFYQCQGDYITNRQYPDDLMIVIEERRKGNHGKNL